MLLSQKGSWRKLVLTLAKLWGVVLPGLLAGCLVHPLYQSAESGFVAPLVGAGQGRADTFVQTPIAIVSSGVGLNQDISNALIFLLYGGAGMPASVPRYQLSLQTQTHADFLRPHLAAVADRRLLGLLDVRVHYCLKNAQGKTCFENVRYFSTALEHGQNEFSNLQSVQAAQQHAAQELAQWIFLDLVAWLHKQVH